MPTNIIYYRRKMLLFKKIENQNSESRTCGRIL